MIFVPLHMNGSQCKIPDVINKQDADGAIILHDAPVSILERLDELTLPYVLLDWQGPTNNRKNVSLDCELPIHKAVMHLIEKGHKRIAFMGSDHLPHYYLRCFSAYQNALEEALLPIYPGWLQNSVSDVESASISLQKMMRMKTPPTAVCFMNDMCAVYALKAAATLGIKIPSQLSFISIDDITISSYVHPELTTVSYDKSEIGTQTAQLLVGMLNGEERESVVISSDVVVNRRSVAAPSL
jgi:DNA-binding LacI/PurR family transcriptional regulator